MIEQLTINFEGQDFVANLEKDSDGDWKIWIPSLEECTAWGCSKKDAIKRIKGAILSCLDDDN